MQSVKFRNMPEIKRAAARSPPGRDLQMRHCGRDRLYRGDHRGGIGIEQRAVAGRTRAPGLDARAVIQEKLRNRFHEGPPSP